MRPLRGQDQSKSLGSWFLGLPVYFQFYYNRSRERDVTVRVGVTVNDRFFFYMRCKKFTLGGFLVKFNNFNGKPLGQRL